MKKKIKLENYPNIIEFLKKSIKLNNISLNYLSKQLDIPRSQIKRVLNNEIKNTKINLLELYLLVKQFSDEPQNNIKNKIMDNSLSNKSENKINKARYYQILSNRTYATKILYLVSITKRISNYKEFFYDAFYLIQKEKVEKFEKDLTFLFQKNIIATENDSLFPGSNFFVPDIPSRTKVLYLNFALTYFEKKRMWKTGFILSLHSNNSRKRELFLMEYIYELSHQQKHYKIISILASYFKWLKQNNKRKSREFKIFYIALMINIYSDDNNLINIFLYGNYLMKYLPIKENLLSYDYNTDFKLSDIYKLDKIYSPNFNTLSYFIFCSFIDIQRCYIKFQLFDHATQYVDYFIKNLPANDQYYIYFFQFKSIILSYFGSLNDYKKLKILIDEIPDSNINKYEVEFKIDHTLSILTLKKNNNTFTNLNKYFNDNFKKNNIHPSYLELFCERYILGCIFQKQFKLALSLVIYFYYNKIMKKKFESEAFLFFLFLAILKNNKSKSLLLEPFLDCLTDLKTSELNGFFSFPDQNTLYKIAQSFFNEKLKININFSNDTTLWEVFSQTIKKMISNSQKFKTSYDKLLLDIQKKKNYLFEYINKILEENFPSVVFFNNKVDPIKFFIQKFPFNNQFLSIFSYQSSEKHVFSNLLAIQEINFYLEFIGCLSADLALNKKSLNNEYGINFNEIYFYITNKVDISHFYTEFFTQYIENLSSKIIYQQKINKTNNLTHLFFNLFNLDKDKPFLNYIRSYILRYI